MSKSKLEILWLEDAEPHNFPAALAYLSLIYPTKTAQKLMAQLQAATLAEFKAKDIFRASGLSLLGVSNSHVAVDQKKIENGEQLSPLLLVRDPAHGRVIIADGYHRLCAVYSFDEDALIRCRIADGEG